MYDSSDRSESDYKKSRKGDYKKSYVFKKSSIRKEVKKALKGVKLDTTALILRIVNEVYPQLMIAMIAEKG